MSHLSLQGFDCNTKTVKIWYFAYKLPINGLYLVNFKHFFAARCYASAAYVVMRCLSVRLSVCVSVTFMDHVKTNKHIKIFSASDNHAILVFFLANGIAKTGTPLTGASNAGGVCRNRDSEPISGLTACVNAATGRCCNL